MEFQTKCVRNFKFVRLNSVRCGFYVNPIDDDCIVLLCLVYRMVYVGRCTMFSIGRWNNDTVGPNRRNKNKYFITREWGSYPLLFV